MKHPVARRGLRPFTLVLLMSLLAAVVFPATARDHKRYIIGNPDAPTPGQVSPGLLLMGGGDRNFDALRWFLKKAGNGHLVVLRASQGNEVAEEFYRDVGGIASVETFVFSGPGSSNDPKILASLAKADGIFIAGGDQARYVRFWKGTPVAVALDAHLRAGKPIGGTSAGLAILGEYLYGAMDDGSIRSPEALADPLGAAVTIEQDFLHVDRLKGIVTDTHFKERDRLGRLFAFVAKAETLTGTPMRPLIGLGVDESAALAVEADGSSRIYATDPAGGAWLVRGGFPDKQATGKPLGLRRVDVTGIGAGSVVHLPEGRVEAPVFQRTYRVDNGRLQEVAPMMLAIHGGAGVERRDMTPDDERDARAALEMALRRGHAELKAGKSAVDAVTAAITVLEDDPHFNAGRGAVFTHDGRNELDTSIMDGRTRKAGAAAGLHRVKNPILLARAIMERSEHVMMVGDGAEVFAAEQGIELVDPSWFRTEKRWQQLQRRLREKQQGAIDDGRPGRRYTGTVGAVALDGHGGLAAGTSTGGMTDKRYGRVGDSPIIGAGTWADDRCAFSGTGWGEFYIRSAAAHEVCARMRYLNEGPAEAGHAVINVDVPALGGDGGAIVIGADGRIGFPFNTEGMFRGWIDADGVPHIAIYAEDPLPLPVAPAP
ncbi:MAG: type 1 glutamine amidotransferase-like domain-containing protein [Lysobacter sp.]|nr:type 1 glutamine amidotransferase-like domain-containing protein [Lysobacter sp.]